MVSPSTLFEYACDLLYAGIQYESGLSRRDVARGYFASTPHGNLQQIFFHELLACGFRRTHWQIVFPGQTAGLIRKIDPPIQGMDEIHIRFYEEGRICAELEYGRFSLGHFRAQRVPSTDILEHILVHEMDSLSSLVKEGIRT